METKGHRRLRRLLRLSGLPHKDFAKSVGIKPMQLSHLITGRRRASLEIAVALEHSTKEAIRPRDWLKEV